MKDQYIQISKEPIDPKVLEMQKYLLKKRADELTQINVIYRPNCGCPIEQFVVLDRYPMSPKIMNICPECKKGCLSEISDPIIFNTQIGGDFTLDDLKSGVITDSPQKPFLDCYRNNNI